METYDAAVYATAEYFVPDTSGTFIVSVQYQNHGVHGFNAGANRDQGTSYLLGAFPALSGIIYLDGDCVPSPTMVSGFRNLFAQAGSVPVLGNGTRSHSTSGLVDTRINSPVHGQSVFKLGMDRVVLHDRDLRGARVCWSCLCGMNVPAIRLVRALNRSLFGDSNRVFASTWDGRYGAEDTLLGLQVFRAQGVVVAMDPLVVSAVHQDHVTKWNTDAAVSNNSTLPKTDALLIKHLQCQTPCYVTLSTGVYMQTTRLRNLQMRDNDCFYNNILSVNVPARASATHPPAMELVTLACLGLLDPDIPLLRQLALFQVGRVVSYTYGSGATLASSLPRKNAKDSASTDMMDTAQVVWRTIKKACVSFPVFVEKFKQLSTPNQR
jgi:hypothetical protein